MSEEETIPKSRIEETIPKSRIRNWRDEPPEFRAYLQTPMTPNAEHPQFLFPTSDEQPGEQPVVETVPKCVYTENKTESIETQEETIPKTLFTEDLGTSPAAGGRRSSAATQSQAEKLEDLINPILEDFETTQLAGDESGHLSIVSDMRGLQTHVHGSSNVHVGPKVYDQRNVNVERFDSRVDNLHRHEHIQNKTENIQNKTEVQNIQKHEHVQNKTEVQNIQKHEHIQNKTKVQNIQKHEHIQNKTENIQNIQKHEHIQSKTEIVNKTEIVHNKAEAIYAGRVHVHYDCRHEPLPPLSTTPPQVEPKPRVSPTGSEEEPAAGRVPRLVQDSRKFLETRYISWTTLSTPLPWCDDIVLDLSKSCVDFTMVSTGSGSRTKYNSLEELVTAQQAGKAMRITVEGNAGYGKTTLAAKIAYDWANGRDYLSRFTHVFLIFLREFREPLDLHIKAQHYPKELSDAEAFLMYLKNNQEKVLFIFDGYDELAKEHRGTVDQIMGGSAFMQSSAVVTSRPTEMPFKKYCMCVGLTGFDDSKKADFVRLLYEDKPRMRIDEFLCVLEKDRNVRDLAQCPLMCLLLCEMHQRGTVGAQATKSRLYVDLFRYLVANAVHRKHAPLVIDTARYVNEYNEMLAKFGGFCMKALAKDQLSFTAQEIPTDCDPDRLFEIGFLIQFRNFSTNIGSQKYYEPIHKTFMEFLAAKYLQSLSSDEEVLKRELQTLKQSVSRSSERLILQYLCGLMQADAWTIMEQLEPEGAGSMDFIFCLLREAGETPQNVAAVCRRLPHDKVTIRGSDKRLDMWAQCLSSPACEVRAVEFIWEFDNDTWADTTRGPDFARAQLAFWRSLQSCSNISEVRITFCYGHTSNVPGQFMDALCECMKNCARLAKLSVLHIKAIAPANPAEAFTPVIGSLSQHVRSCSSLHELTMEMMLSSEMTERLCLGLHHVPKLHTLRLPRLFCDALGFSSLAGLVRRHMCLKTLEVSVSLVDGPMDLYSANYSRLNKIAMTRNRDVSALYGEGASGTAGGKMGRKAPLHRIRKGPDEELGYLREVLGINLTDDTLRAQEGIWHLLDQGGSQRGNFPLPMCDPISHNSGYHQLFEALRSRGSRLEQLVIGRESLTKKDFACLGETIRKSESLTELKVANVEKSLNLFPLVTALPAARRLESLCLRSSSILVDDQLFSILCSCLLHNRSLQHLDIRQWRFQLQNPASLEHLRSLLKNMTLQEATLSECQVNVVCRAEDAVFSCASLAALKLSQCKVERGGAILRGPTFLPLLQALSTLKELDLSDRNAEPLSDAAVKMFFAGISSFKTLQKLSLSSWKYDVTNPDIAYMETKAAARRWGRLTTVVVDGSQFSARAATSSKQWLVQALATGVPHLQELVMSNLLEIGVRFRSAMTHEQMESLARAILRTRWTGDSLQLHMRQRDPSLLEAFIIRVACASSRVQVNYDGRVVVLKRPAGPFTALLDALKNK